MHKKYEIEFGGKSLSIESGRWPSRPTVHVLCVMEIRLSW